MPSLWREAGRLFVRRRRISGCRGHGVLLLLVRVLVLVKTSWRWAARGAKGIMASKHVGKVDEQVEIRWFGSVWRTKPFEDDQVRL